jgi:hypothetical protein
MMGLCTLGFVVLEVRWNWLDRWATASAGRLKVSEFAATCHAHADVMPLAQSIRCKIGKSLWTSIWHIRRHYVYPNISSWSLTLITLGAYSTNLLIFDEGYGSERWEMARHIEGCRLGSIAQLTAKFFFLSSGMFYE